MRCTSRPAVVASTAWHSGSIRTARSSQRRCGCARISPTSAGRRRHRRARLPRGFDSNGPPRPGALRLPPNLADMGWPPAPPPRDEPQDVLDEAFALAAFSGRIEVMVWLRERGADVNGAAHLGLTGLH